MAPPPLISYEQSLKLRPSKFAEVVNGKLISYEKPPREQSRVMESLRHILWSQISRQTVDVWTTSFSLLIRQEPALTYREPDLGMFLRANRRMQDRYIVSPPELLVETAFHREHKGSFSERVSDYEAIGVPELWILDLSRTEWRRMRLSNGKLVGTDVLRTGLVSPASFPTAKVPLVTLWATLERAQLESGRPSPPNS